MGDFLLGPQLDEFYENGILKILHALPMNFSKDARLAIESVVYISYGYHRIYRRLELELGALTTNEGDINLTDSARIREIVANIWSLVDYAYAITKLAPLKAVISLLEISNNLQLHLSGAATARNYMDHLAANFKNLVHGKNDFPLFGWITYQFSPILRDQRQPPNKMHVVGFASTHVDGLFTINLPSCSSADIYSVIDNIALHTRRTGQVNLSRLYVELTLSLNEFSIQSQRLIMEAASAPDFVSGGLRVPFAKMIATADLKEQNLEVFEIVSILNENKIRMDVHLQES